jgi:hypothetical protein
MKRFYGKKILAEVEQTIMEIPKGKSAGLDRFIIDLFQSCCPIIHQGF